MMPLDVATQQEIDDGINNMLGMPESQPPATRQVGKHKTYCSNLSGLAMLYLDEPDWLDVINCTSEDTVAAEHIVALAKLKRLVIVGNDGFEYTPFEDNEGAWSMLLYHRDDEE